MKNFIKNVSITIAIIVLVLFGLNALLNAEIDKKTYVGMIFDEEKAIGKTEQEIIDLYGDFDSIHPIRDENGQEMSNEYYGLYLAFGRESLIVLISDPPRNFFYWLHIVDGVVVDVKLERIPGD